jgi:hypothetical protein
LAKVLLDLPGMTVSPLKADPPLIVDANTVLAGTVATQPFQAIGRRHAQILQRLRPAKHTQLAQGNLLNVGWQPARPLPVEDLLCFCVPETLDHVNSL